MIGCAYCGNIIGTIYGNGGIETIAYWTHVKFKHFNHPLFQEHWRK